MVQRARTKEPGDAMADKLDWAIDGKDWPLHAASRFVTAGALTWHVQELGHGDALLLVHGTGASTHSFRGLAPLLATRWRVVMADLPGHGFTSAATAQQLSLPGMAQALGALIAELGIVPALAIGHSAGAAILARMTLDRVLGDTPHLIGLNAALLPLGGVAGQVFSPIAKLLVLNPLVPRFLSWRAESTATIDKLMADVGSDIGAEGVAYYRRLFRSPAHVAAALGMMANWDLRPLAAELPHLPGRLTLIACGNDRAISPDDAFRVRDLRPSTEVDYVRGLGHLAHEENPTAIFDRVIHFAESSSKVQTHSSEC
jgi:magnesium chelatase accessory protein